MKKTLVSIIAGLTVIGSAFALPTPDDRKRLCEQKPDKFVWVEKTQACIPINPCESGDTAVKFTYCADVKLLRDDKKDKEIINRYASYRLGTDLDLFKMRTFHDPDGFGFYTTDGGYIAFEYDNILGSTKVAATVAAFDTYGVRNEVRYDEPTMVKGDISKADFVCGHTAFDTLCQDIKDFASLLYGEEILVGDYHDSVEGFNCNCYINVTEK